MISAEPDSIAWSKSEGSGISGRVSSGSESNVGRGVGPIGVEVETAMGARAGTPVEVGEGSTSAGCVKVCDGSAGADVHAPISREDTSRYDH
jgi:hypothetical protein